MEVHATIKKIYPKRTITTNNSLFTSQPLTLEQKEEIQLWNGNVLNYTHTFFADLTGKQAETFNLPVGTDVVANLHFNAKEGKGGQNSAFQSVRITYLRVDQDNSFVIKH